MIIRTLKFAQWSHEAMSMVYGSDKPAHLGVLNAFFRALDWNVQVSRHDQSDGGQLYLHGRDDLSFEEGQERPVNADFFFQGTVDCVFRADTYTFNQWIDLALERQRGSEERF